jgi:hypothetical protein
MRALARTAVAVIAGTILLDQGVQWVLELSSGWRLLVSVLALIALMWAVWPQISLLNHSLKRLVAGVVIVAGVLLVIKVFWHDGEEVGSVEKPPDGRAVGRAAPDQEPAVAGAPTVEAEPPRAYVRERSPSEILGTLNSLSPLERPRYFHNVYDGRWVRWSGVVSSIRELSFHIEVTVLDSLGSVNASLSFRPDERASLESLRPGDRIMYVGMIEDGRLALLDPLLTYVDEPKILQVFPDTTR